MKITADVREYAATLNDKEVGMAQMSDKFNAMGQQVYVEAGAAGTKPPHTTALQTEAEHHAKNAGLVKESNRAFG